MGYVIENKAYRYYIGAAQKLTKLPHIHTHLEMVYLRQGKTTAVLDRQRFPVEAGDLFLAFPNQIHYYEGDEPVRIVISIFSPDLHRELEKLLSGKIPVCPVLKRSELPENTEKRLLSILTLQRSGSPYGRLQATGKLLAFFGEILPLFRYEESTADQDSVKRILRYCSEHYTEQLTLDVLSRELYLSKFYISRVFHDRMKFSFTEFIGNLRVSYACDLLETNSSITEVAMAAGFSSIRTFNRVFLRVMGMTPREYWKANQKKETGSGKE